MTDKKKAPKKKVPKKANGRPTKYKEEYCEQIIEMGLLGKSRVQCAVKFKVCRDTLHEWGTKHQLFSDALKQAQENAEAYWEDKIIELLEDGDNGAGKSPISMFYMKCRFGWRDRDATQLNVGVQSEGTGETNFNFNTLPDSKFDPEKSDK